jgi:hypothetical protein
MVEADEEDDVGVSKNRLALFDDGAFSKLAIDRVFVVMVRPWCACIVIILMRSVGWGKCVGARGST